MLIKEFIKSARFKLEKEKHESENFNYKILIKIYEYFNHLIQNNYGSLVEYFIGNCNNDVINTLTKYEFNGLYVLLHKSDSLLDEQFYTPGNALDIIMFLEKINIDNYQYDYSYQSFKNDLLNLCKFAFENKKTIHVVYER
jgi:hypothetical protein